MARIDRGAGRCRPTRLTIVSYVNSLESRHLAARPTSHREKNAMNGANVFSKRINGGVSQIPSGESPSEAHAGTRQTPAAGLRSQGRAGLDVLFHPRSIAVIGASEREGSLGRVVFRNLIDGGFAGNVWPVNRKRQPVFGRETAASLLDLPSAPDLAVIVTPARTVETVLQDCVQVGVRGAIILSSGMHDTPGHDPEGASSGLSKHGIRDRVREIARSGGIRIVGPNCLGVMSPAARMNATFAPSLAKPGKIAFLSQSGALCAALLDWSLSEEVGFRAIMSLGDMFEVGWADAIDYFGQDAGTGVILCYVESVGDARGFLAAVRRHSLSKPVVVLKGGQTLQAAQAVCSHTGALAGSDLVFQTAMRRAGAIQVDDLQSLLAMAEVLARRPCPAGGRLTVLTNAGGPAVLATDALVQRGGTLAPLSLRTMEALDAFLPPHWSRRNPVDIGGDADPQRFERTLDCLLCDPDSDGVLVIETPQAMSDPVGTARRLAPRLARSRKAVLTSWMGGAAAEPARKVFDAASLPTFDFPDTAAQAFARLSRHAEDLRHLYETPRGTVDPDEIAVRTAAVETILSAARDERRTLLTEEESKRVLAAYGIPVVPTEVARTEVEAIAVAERLGFPVVLKVHSRRWTHKSELNGVQLDLAGVDEVRRAFGQIAESVRKIGGADAFEGVAVQAMVKATGGYELILGSSYDPQFGPVLLFGSGGILTQVIGDHAAELPPLNTTLARRLVERTRIATALKGIRGRPPVDRDQLDQVLIAFANLVTEHPEIRECDVNPLLASAEGVVALDARIVLQPTAAGRPLAPLAPPAIRPYPIEYVHLASLRDGTRVVLRPIRLEDEPAVAEFQTRLSEEAIHQRYFELVSLARRTEHRYLVHSCLTDFECEMALVAELQDSKEVVALGCLSRGRNEVTADFGLLVADAWQKKGLGRLLLERLIEVGKREGVLHIEGPLLSDNHEMAQLCRDLGFRLEEDFVDRSVLASLDLAAAVGGRTEATP